MTLGNKIDTPAFITDQRMLQTDLALIRKIADQGSCKLLYSPKANALATVLEGVAPVVDGFACSSLFELRLVDELCEGTRSLHLVSPLIKRETLEQVVGRLGYLTVNSLSQWRQLRSCVSPATSVGLRVNPQLSFVRDSRYDPCRQYSKLGVPISTLADLMRSEPVALRGLSGLHFHNNCEATNFAGLLATAQQIQKDLPEFLKQLDWINLGGGYLFDMACNYDDFFEAVALFREGFDLEVFIEPGAAVVRRCGTIEATVHDLMCRDGAQIAILDTTVNHMPEVFEFQYEPDVLGHVDGGRYDYILAGCTCLAGDIFGHYSFDHALTVGSRIKFLNMGAYSMSKAHRFNGVALPTLYSHGLDGSLVEVRADSFDEFARFAGHL
jgi:carboxynorspermidine decarboxylase